jgi:hypothetical protein
LKLPRLCCEGRLSHREWLVSLGFFSRLIVTINSGAVTANFQRCAGEGHSPYEDGYSRELSTTDVEICAGVPSISRCG